LGKQFDLVIAEIVLVVSIHHRAPANPHPLADPELPINLECPLDSSRESAALFADLHLPGLAASHFFIDVPMGDERILFCPVHKEFSFQLTGYLADICTHGSPGAIEHAGIYTDFP